MNQDGTNAGGNTGIWASTTASATFIYNSNTNRRYFPSGMYWQFDCASVGIEGDYSSRYPTLVQDTNGNQILIRYKAGVIAVDSGGNNIYLTWGNSSGRIDQIEDVRAVGVGGGLYATYQFNYQNDLGGVPHLQSITNTIQTSEGYGFTYNLGQSLVSPWGSAFGTTARLASISITGVGLSYSLAYDTNGSALNRVTQVASERSTSATTLVTTASGFTSHDIEATVKWDAGADVHLYGGAADFGDESGERNGYGLISEAHDHSRNSAHVAPGKSSWYH